MVQKGDKMATKKKYVKIEEIASLFRLTVRRIQQLTQDGVLNTHQITEAGKKVKRYEFTESIQGYIQYLSDKANGKAKNTSTEEKEDAKLQAEVDMKTAKAKIVQLNLKELEGRLHAAEDVEAMTTDLVLYVRSAVLSIPGQVAVDVAEVSDPAEVSNIISEVVNNILKDLSNYRYNPEEYQRRVRERQGWLYGSSEAEDEETG